jgi:hypothetical protein
MKNLLRGLLIATALAGLFGCPKKDTTTPATGPSSEPASAPESAPAP